MVEDIKPKSEAKYANKIANYIKSFQCQTEKYHYKIYLLEKPSHVSSQCQSKIWNYRFKACF